MLISSLWPSNHSRRSLSTTILPQPIADSSFYSDPHGLVFPKSITRARQGDSSTRDALMPFFPFQTENILLLMSFGTDIEISHLLRIKSVRVTASWNIFFTYLCFPGLNSGHQNHTCTFLCSYTSLDVYSNFS